MNTARTESAVRPFSILRGCIAPASDDGNPLPLPNDWVIQKLFGARHWCTPWVSELCKADPAFLWHLTQQAAGYVHFLCLVHLGIESGTTAWREKPSSQLGRALRTKPRREVLTELFPDAGIGLLAILKKLNPHPMGADIYAALPRLMMPSPLADMLRHAKQISPYAVRFLADADPELAPLRLWLDISNRAALKKARYFHAVCRTLPPSDCGQTITQRLEKMSQLQQIECWLRRQLMTWEFPMPPWPGNKWLYPLRTGAELKAASLRFKNCAFRYFDDLLLGKCQFYISERGPIMYRIDRDPIFAWRIGEKEAIKGKRLANVHEQECLGEFAAAGIYSLDDADEHHTTLLSGKDPEGEWEF